MRVPDRVREWDERLLPVMAGRVRALQQRLLELKGRWEPPATRGSVPQELDRRFGHLRPIAAVRELPQLGFIAIAVVLLAGTVTAVVRHEPPAPPPAVEDLVAGPQPGSGTVTLGPVEGTTVTEYTAAADSSVARAVQGGSEARRTALVSLSAYRTQGQAASLLADVDVRRFYLRATAGGRDAALLPFEVRTSLPAELRTAYLQAARSLQEARKSYLGYVETTENDKPYQKLYQDLADGAERQARAYRTGCACVLAAVVEAPVAALVELRSRTGVRALEIAPRVVTFRELDVTPLLPETRGRIGRLTSPGEPAP